jgi:hypothetical protein
VNEVERLDRMLLWYCDGISCPYLVLRLREAAEENYACSCCSQDDNSYLYQFNIPSFCQMEEDIEQEIVWEEISS